jgi:hypothetical protein
MAYVFPHHLARASPVFRDRQHSPRRCSFIVLKTVDPCEQLILDQRAFLRQKVWKEPRRIMLVGLVIFVVVLVLYLLGLAYFPGTATR